MGKMEEIVIVDGKGYIKRFSTSKSLQPEENIAVELVMVYLPKEKQIVLFNRGSGASDMHDHWALEAGKVIVEDLCSEDGDCVGTKISLNAYRSSATREFNEELRFAIAPHKFEFVDEFHMPGKNLYFTLLSLAIEKEELDKLSPDQSEVDKVRCFTLNEFDNNPDLGDAIMFRKERIIQYLQEKFGGSA
jgi:hypothetical protein